MGFKPEPTVLNLTFSGTALDGLKVKMTSCTLREFDWMTKFDIEGRNQKEIDEHNDAVLALFFEHLEFWDLDGPDGEPTAKTKEGVSVHEPWVIRSIMSAWQLGMVTVPGPLQTKSINGSISEELSLGLDASSESLPNSSEPMF